MNSSPQLFTRRRRIWWSKALTIAIIAAALVVTVVSVALAKTFPDVPSGYPYAAAISQLADQGVIDGCADGRFGPSDSVKRQQFAKLMILAAGQTATEADVTTFTDVTISGPGSLYPDNYVAKIASLGITLGKTATTFDPYAFITRAQMITMVVRAADNLFPGTLGTPPAGYVSTWDPSFPESAREHASRRGGAGALQLHESGQSFRHYYDDLCRIHHHRARHHNHHPGHYDDNYERRGPRGSPERRDKPGDREHQRGPERDLDQQ